MPENGKKATHAVRASAISACETSLVAAKKASDEAAAAMGRAEAAGALTVDACNDVIIALERYASLIRSAAVAWAILGAFALQEQTKAGLDAEDVTPDPSKLN